MSKPILGPIHKKQKQKTKTKMHSSRMHTARSLTVSRSICYAHTPLPRTPPPPTHALPAMHVPRLPMPPPTEFLTHTSENCTLPQLRCRVVMTNFKTKIRFRFRAVQICLKGDSHCVKTNKKAPDILDHCRHSTAPGISHTHLNVAFGTV